MHTTKISINNNPVTLQVPDDDSDDPTSVEWKPPQEDLRILHKIDPFPWPTPSDARKTKAYLARKRTSDRCRAILQYLGGISNSLNRQEAQ